jgi:hypothetical protein
VFALGVAHWAAIAIGLATVAWIYWYFFRAGRGS